MAHPRPERQSISNSLILQNDLVELLSVTARPPDVRHHYVCRPPLANVINLSPVSRHDRDAFLVDRPINEESIAIMPRNRRQVYDVGQGRATNIVVPHVRRTGRDRQQLDQIVLQDKAVGDRLPLRSWVRHGLAQGWAPKPAIHPTCVVPRQSLRALRLQAKTIQGGVVEIPPFAGPQRRNPGHGAW